MLKQNKSQFLESYGIQRFRVSSTLKILTYLLDNTDIDVSDYQLEQRLNYALDDLKHIKNELKKFNKNQKK